MCGRQRLPNDCVVVWLAAKTTERTDAEPVDNYPSNFSQFLSVPPLAKYAERKPATVTTTFLLALLLLR